MTDFQEKLVIAILALLLGWTLKEISEWRKQGSERKRALSRSFACMVALYDRIISFEQTSKKLLQIGGDVRGAETLRKRNQEYLNRSIEALMPQLMDSTDCYNNYLPFRARNVNFIQNLVVETGLINFENISRTVPNDYFKIVEEHNKLYRDLLNHIDKEIVFLSKQLSTIAWLRTIALRKEYRKKRERFPIASESITSTIFEGKSFSEYLESIKKNSVDKEKDSG